MGKKQMESSLEMVKARINRAMTFRPIDDPCGSVFFQDIGCTQILLRAVMEKPEMVIKEMAPQFVLSDLFGRGGRLDVVAFDSASGAYNLEFQTDKKGAVLDRAFFNYALLSRHLIDKGTEFKDFPCTSIVFVQEDDYFHTNQAKAKVKFILDGNPPVPLRSKLDIVYVNTNVKDNETMLGKVLHDLRCSSADEMLVPEFAYRMEQVKNPKGKEMEFMCEALALERAEGREEGRMEGRMEMARENAMNLFRAGSSFETARIVFQDIFSQDELLQIRQESREAEQANAVVH